MWIHETLRENLQWGSGGVRRYRLAGKKIQITRITLFCPEDVGPGATHVYLVDSGALVLLDTGLPTRVVQTRLYSWFNRPVPSEIGVLPPDLSEKELNEGLRIAGYSLSDIDLLVISHGHWDHFLLGRTIVERAGTAVAAHVLETLKMVEALQRVTVRDGVQYFQASEESFDAVYNRILDLVKDRATVPMMRY